MKQKVALKGLYERPMRKHNNLPGPQKLLPQY
jgi:hypothetical protein